MTCQHVISTELIKIGRKEIESDVFGWINLPHNGVQWMALVNSLKKLQFHKRLGIF
jgi:hypothetical protein